MKYPAFLRMAIAVFFIFAAAQADAARNAAPRPGTYTVRTGDTFAKIARTNNLPLADLLRANRISNPNRILLGQKIVIPAPGGKGSSPAVRAPGGGSGRGSGVSDYPHRRPDADDTVDISPPGPIRGVGGSTRARRSQDPVDISRPAAKGTYVVAAGDTLSKIQRRYGTPVAELIRLNHLSPDGAIHPGQTLRLTSRSKPVPIPARRPPVVPSPAVDHDDDESVANESPPADTHVVARGETFSSIARLHGVTWAALARANRALNPERLHPGQRLRLPLSTSDPTRSRPEPLVVRDDGRIIAARPDPLAVPWEAPASAGREKTGYLVEDGDNLDGIAQRFYTTPDEIRRLNRKRNYEQVYPGEYLIVPFYRGHAHAPARFGHRA